MTSLQKEVLYVAFDVEAAGLKLGRHSVLSVAACALVREDLTFIIQTELFVNVF